MASAAQHPADLAALTGRDDFLLELGELLGGRASVHPADSIEAALGHLSQARGNRVLAIDTRDTGDVSANVARAAEQTPDAVILVFTETQSEKEIAAALKGTRVFAVLPVPLEADKTAAVLQAALTHTGGRAARRQSAADNKTHDMTEKPAAAEPPARRVLVRAGMGAAVAALAAAGGWYLLHGRTPVPAPPRGRIAAAHATALAQPVVDTSIVRGRVDDLLDKASRAMFARHFTTPTGANALVYYRSVLAIDPTNGEARNGLQRVGHVLISRFDEMMSRAQYPQAALALATLKVAEPTDPHIASFQHRLFAAQISRALAGGHPALAAALLAQAARAGVPAAQRRTWRRQLWRMKQQRKVQSLAAAIGADIGADDFNGASGALATLAQLRTAAPAAAQTRHAGRALIKALLAKAGQDALAGNTAEESGWLNEARSIGASAGDIDAFEQGLVAARAQAAKARMNRLLALARERLGSGALTRPQDDSAAYYLTALARTRPTGAARAAEQQMRGELAGKLLVRAERAAASGKGAAAQADVSQARFWGASAAAVRAAMGAISAALHRAQAPTATELQRLAARLVRTRYVPPSYPQHALARRIAGQVTVQFVIDTKGVPRDVRVTSAQPAGVFNHAALAAIRAWRYRPARFRGHPIDVPVRTLIRFVLPH